MWKAKYSSGTNYVSPPLPVSTLTQPMLPIPALCGRSALNDTVRDFLALPARLGGMGLINPSSLSTEHRRYSTHGELDSEQGQDIRLRGLR